MEQQDFTIKTDQMRDSVTRIIGLMSLPFEVTVQPFRSKRSSAQNRLYWKWLGEIKEQYIPEGGRLTKRQWDHMCLMKFIGIAVVELKGEVYTMPEKSSKELKVDEFSEYLLKIESEFIPKGVRLTFPDDYGLAMGLS